MNEPEAHNNANLMETNKAGLDVTVIDHRCPKSVLQFLMLCINIVTMHAKAK